MRVLLIILLLVACGRPLTPSEAAFMADLQGDALDTAPIRIVENPLIGTITLRYPARPATTCRERIFPAPQGDIVEGRVAGMVLFNRLHVRPDINLPDYTLMPDGRRHLAAAMFFAHEMTHIWQWQNRAITGYHPLRAAREHALIDDPYRFDPQSEIPFLAYGYEQQASLVEEYVCCRTLDPQGARTTRLEALLSQAMPVTPLQSRADGIVTVLPWAGVQTRGICS